MWRSLHSLPGLFSLVLIAVVAISGSILAIYPVADRLSPDVQAVSGLSVADVAGKVAAIEPDIGSLTRKPSGALVLSYFDAQGNPLEGYVDARTGAIIEPVTNPAWLYRTLKSFHRSLFLGNNGRYISALAGAFVVLLSLSGIFLMISRMGGVARLLDAPRGNWSARYHMILSRLVLVPLLLSALTGIYAAATDLGYVSLDQAASQVFPESTQGLPAVSPATLKGLADIPLSELHVLTFPMAGDTLDVFTADTETGVVVVDQFSGAVLEQVPATVSQTLYNWIYALHTGVGMAWLSIILGLASLTVPLIGVTGAVMWWTRTRGSNQRIRGNHSASEADLVILVGSEGGTTWGFARSLHRDLVVAGHKVHVAAMNQYRDHYRRATSVLFLTSTYGNGNAPDGAKRFAALLTDQARVPSFSYCVLGFGDRAFPRFCQFAKDLDADLENHGWARLLPPTYINRQSSQAFATWGVDLAKALGNSLSLSHQVQLPPTRHLKLIERTDYGSDIQAPTVVLRFAYEEGNLSSWWDRALGRDGKRPRFAPSDLLGVLPPGSTVPRYYSVASGPSNDAVEICVRKQPHGECSGFLHNLKLGDKIECFVKTNPDFRAAPGRKPVIMVGAGTGIAPFMGMIRANTRHRETHLFWGGRDPAADFLYQDVLAETRRDNRLASLTTAFSRVQNRAYVQDKLREQTSELAAMLRRGATVMVCGGDAMAKAVAAEFETILEPAGVTVAQLKARGLYLEDIF